MYVRLVNTPKKQSFFLFGARATGKSTFLRTLYSDNTCHFIDLLLPAIEERFARRPEELLSELAALPESIEWVVLDEVQKVLKLLDVVHHVLENNTRGIRFALTGSSGRKLKRGGANLLGGRAFVYDLFPLTFFETATEFDLQESLSWGSLPILNRFCDAHEKEEFLYSYVRLYLSEEIQKEQVVRNLDPFRHFLEIASQHNGKIINYSNIAKGIGVDPKTVSHYYQILEDTLVGSFLLPFSFSFRKKLLKAPKFYFFDTGVCRAMARHLSMSLNPSTSYYGDVFEHFIVINIKAMCSYKMRDARVSYYQDENGIEIDIVIERPGLPLLFIEIKSSTQATEEMTKNSRLVQKHFNDAEFEVWTRDPIAKRFGTTLCLNWKNGLTKLFNMS